MHAKLLQSCPTLCSPVDCSPPGSLSMGFSRQEYWSGLPCPPPGDLPNPGIKLKSLMSPALGGRFFTTSATWDSFYEYQISNKNKNQEPVDRDILGGDQGVFLEKRASVQQGFARHRESTKRGRGRDKEARRGLHRRKKKNVKLE